MGVSWGFSWGGLPFVLTGWLVWMAISDRMAFSYHPRLQRIGLCLLILLTGVITICPLEGSMRPTFRVCVAMESRLKTKFLVDIIRAVQRCCGNTAAADYWYLRVRGRYGTLHICQLDWPGIRGSERNNQVHGTKTG